jgi:two-component sensor histidine kinase
MDKNSSFVYHHQFISNQNVRLMAMWVAAKKSSSPVHRGESLRNHLPSIICQNLCSQSTEGTDIVFKRIRERRMPVDSQTVTTLLIAIHEDVDVVNAVSTITDHKENGTSRFVLLRRME